MIDPTWQVGNLLESKSKTQDRHTQLTGHSPNPASMQQPSASPQRASATSLFCQALRWRCRLPNGSTVPRTALGGGSGARLSLWLVAPLCSAALCRGTAALGLVVYTCTEQYKIGERQSKRATRRVGAYHGSAERRRPSGRRTGRRPGSHVPNSPTAHTDLTSWRACQCRISTRTYFMGAHTAAPM